MQINGHIVRRATDNQLIYIDDETTGVWASAGNAGGMLERKQYLEEQIKRCNLIIEFLQSEAAVVEKERQDKALKLAKAFYRGDTGVLELAWSDLDDYRQKRFLALADEVEFIEGS